MSRSVLTAATRFGLLGSHGEAAFLGPAARTSAISPFAAPVTLREPAPRPTLPSWVDSIGATSSEAMSQTPPLRQGVADWLEFAVRKPKKRWPNEAWMTLKAN